MRVARYLYVASYVGARTNPVRLRTGIGVLGGGRDATRHQQ
jgi:hypothetical protein